MRIASTYFWMVMLLSLSTPALVFSQNEDKIDSIRKIADSDAKDTSVINNCIKLSEILDDFNMAEAAIYGEKALTVSKEMDYTPGIAMAYYQLGMTHHNLSNYHLSVKYYKQALMLFLWQNENQLVYRCLNRIGNSYYRLGEYEKAKKNIKRSLNYSTIYQDTSNMINCYSNLGGICSYQSDYNSAIEYFYKALKLSENHHKTYVRGVILIGIGKTLTEINNSEKAKDYYFNALEILQQFESNDFLTTCYLQIGDIYMNAMQLDSASIMINNAMQAAKNRQSTPHILNTLHKQGVLLSLNGKNKKALKVQKKVFEISKTKSLINHQMEASSELAELYFKLGAYNKAEKYAKATLGQAESMGAKEARSNALKVLYKINKANGNVTDALAYYEKYAQVRDSIYNVETAELISEYEARYQAEKRKKEILELNRKNQQQEIVLLEERKTKQTQLLVFGVSFIVLLSGTFITYLKVKTNKEKDIANLKEKRFHDVIEAAEMERKRIAGDLHDSVGLMLATTKLNLNELEDSILFKEAKDEKNILEHTLDLIDETSTEVRNISHNMMPGALIELGIHAAVKGLVKNINQLDNFAADFESRGNEIELLEMKRIAIFRIIQEITGNTLKHAGANKISIKFTYYDDYLNIIYTDNGVGIKEVTPDNSRGIGWKSIYSRLEMINGTLNFDNKYSQGTKIQLLIPLN